MYGFKILCEILKAPFEILNKILTRYTRKFALYEVLKTDELWYLRFMTYQSLLRQAPGAPVSNHTMPCQFLYYHENETMNSDKPR